MTIHQKRGGSNDAIETFGGRDSTNTPQPVGQIDFLKLAWRYRFLLLLTASVGVAGGYYHHIRLPVQYVSSAKVQLIEPVVTGLPVDGFDAGRNRRSMTDEALVMRSEGMLRQATEAAELRKTPAFRDWSTDSIVAVLNQMVRIAPVDKSTSGRVFAISYQSSDPVTPQRVVQAVVAAYENHLQSQYSNVGKETVELIQSAKSDVLERLEKLEQDYDEYRQASPLVVRNGRTASIHRDNADNFLLQKQDLIVRKMRLETTLRVANESIKAGEPLESVLIAISGSPTVLNNRPSIANAEIANTKIRQIEQDAQLSPSAQMREARLLPLEIRYSELTEQLGPSHPAAKTLKVEMGIVSAAIARMAESEKELAAKKDEFIASSGVDDQKVIAPEVLLQRNLELQLLALRQQLVAVNQELLAFTAAYEAEIESAKSESLAEMRIGRFEREIARQQALYDRIVARLDEINIAAESGALRVFPLLNATPGTKITPPLANSLILGGFLGVLLAGALISLRELSDQSYKTAQQISEHLGMPVVGHVPEIAPENELINSMGKGCDPYLVSLFRPRSPSSESFKSIRTALFFSNRGGDLKVIQVTSATPGEGKSTVAANLAISMAQSGKSVILVDTDLRRPRVQSLFALENERGLAWLLRQIPKSPSREHVKELLAEVIVDSAVDNLSIIGAGSPPDNPSELLSSMQFDSLITVLRDLFDVVIIDSPPLLAVTDPSILASRVDGVLLVIRLRKNAKPLAARASRMLETLEANVIGVVVNGVGSRAAKGYGKYADTDGYHNRGRNYQYGYGYTYGSYSYGSYDEYYTDDQATREKKAQHKKKPIVEV